jgi:hypothetical protein
LVLKRTTRSDRLTQLAVPANWLPNALAPQDVLGERNAIDLIDEADGADPALKERNIS